MSERQPMLSLILGSASTSRARVLRGAGVRFTQLVSTVDEDAELQAAEDTGTAPGTPAQMAAFLARIKAESVAQNPTAAGAFVLGCDSVFELDGVPYGKPYTEEKAIQRWQLMRGKTGILHTGHTLIDNRPDSAGFGTAVSQLSSSHVSFAEPTDEQLHRYVKTGEPLGCAGGFTIDGHAAAFVTEVRGDHNAVIGVSVSVLADLLARLGADITQLWGAPADD
ncbi:Maf family protein [Micrococcoides hystricis]|uniref:Nucleoside triphosphate pyrophosphatase n=1 Tax=Micrococcoides hystricis TaxID=1572761 RepID=A0ABV6PAC4_9MICC